MKRIIEGYKSYEITDSGVVISHKQKSPKILKLSTDKNGYQIVGIFGENGKQKHKKVHRLVYEAFIGNIEFGMHVNHIDECKSNNHLSNLNLLSLKDNNNYGSRNQRISKSLTNGKRSIRIKATNLLTGETLIFPSLSEVARSGIASASSVSNIINGRYETVNNYAIERI